MKRLAPTVLLSLFIALPAFAADKQIHTETDVKSDADGNYKGTSTYEATDAAGTTQKSTIKETEARTMGGGTKTTAKVESSTDPKGLGNKSWSEKETTVKAKNDGGFMKDETARSVDAQGTTHKLDQTTEAKVNSDGSVDTKVTRKVVTDPKGLMNKSVSKTEETKRAATEMNLAH